jgi:GNAT superfamily N-acetyltransferase
VNVSLRPARPDDFLFARTTYYQTMRSIIEHLFGWDEAREDKAFARQFKIEEVQIITVDGADAGWLQTQVESAAIHLAQLYVVPALQRQGIGTAVLRGLIQEARSEQRALTLAVVKINPAVRLYQRHGFRITHEDQHKFYMRLDCPRAG